MSNTNPDPEATIQIVKMDDMVNLLGAAAITENTENVSSFENLYKNRGRCGNQEERRRSIIETQKSNRYTKLDKFRGIFELVEAVEENIFQTPETHWKPRSYVSGFSKKVPNYCDVLMMSEWMYGKPTDLAENWRVAPCPKGTRMLVLAHKGTTKCFNKYGHFRFECRTELPGGNPCQLKKDKCIVVLDGFYRKDDNTMHVLDILAWNNCVMTEGESAFRDFWLNSQLKQIPELGYITKKNKMIFKIIPRLPCDTQSLNELLMTYPFYNHNMPPVDGLLFYHQKAHYIAGETPVVAWMFPHMAKEILGEDINVHPAYMLERPEGYTNYVDFIEKFESRNFRKRQRKIFGPRDAETGDRIAQIETEGASNSSESNTIADEEDNAIALSSPSEFPLIKEAGKKRVEAKSETVQMESDTNTEDNMEVTAVDNSSAASTNGNAEAVSLPNKAGGDNAESGPKTSQAENMEAMVADIVDAGEN